MSVVVVAVLNQLEHVVTIIAIQIHVNMGHVNRIHFRQPDLFASVMKDGLVNIVNTDHVTT